MVPIPENFPLAMRNNDQDRSQLMQRFYDLHIGASTSARRIFAFQALDTNNPTKIATKTAMDTL